MDEQKVPVLTLNTQSGAQQALEQAVAQLEAPEAPNADNAVAAALDDNFSAEERAEIERFAGTIDVTNPDHVMLYEKGVRVCRQHPQYRQEHRFRRGGGYPDQPDHRAQEL